MKQMRNIGLTLIIGAVFACSVGCVVYWGVLSNQGNSSQSYLEGRAYQPLPAINAESASSGKLQDEFEQFVSDAIYGRETIVLANAAMQRKAIEIASMPLRYKDYPTFFGSNYIFNSRNGAISELPDKQSEAKVNNLHAAALALNSLMSAHRSTHWCIALVDRSCNSIAIPAHDLVANPADYPFYQQTLLNNLISACNQIDLSVKDVDEYYQQFFKTDHHWQIEGAYNAYRSIMKALGNEAIDGEFFTAFKGPFYGSEARNGRYVRTSDYLDDIAYDHSKLVITSDGADKSDDFLDSSYGKTGYKKSHRFENVYASYYHGDPALIEITNAESDNDSTLVIIGDSYTNNIERLFAEAYRKVYVIDPRSYKDGIDTFFNEHDVNDAVFLLSSNTITNEKVIKALTA